MKSHGIVVGLFELKRKTEKSKTLSLLHRLEKVWYYIFMLQTQNIDHIPVNDARSFHYNRYKKGILRKKSKYRLLYYKIQLVTKFHFPLLHPVSSRVNQTQT